MVVGNTHGGFPIAISGAQPPRVIVPAAPTQHTPGAVAAVLLTPGAAVGGGISVVPVPATPDPFSDIAGNLTEPPGID